ncbi:hypothetical protein TgHK011_009262 [Trichoderma gracile]|nr:hypothetical protein TgHK011_009262 [Trichoderma gracile]
MATSRQLAGHQFSEPGRLQIKVGALRLASVRSQCAWRPLTESAALCRVPSGVKRAKDPTYRSGVYCRSREHSALPATPPPGRCGCLKLQPLHLQRLETNASQKQTGFVSDSGGYIIAIVIVDYSCAAISLFRHFADSTC